MKKKLLFFILAFFLLPYVGSTEDPRGLKTIFDYKQEIGLSDGQILAMKQYLVALNQSVKASKAKIVQLEWEFRGLIAREAKVDEVKAKLSEIAEATVAMRLTDYDTSLKINQTMTLEQKSKWRAIQKRMRDDSQKSSLKK